MGLHRSTQRWIDSLLSSHSLAAKPLKATPAPPPNTNPNAFKKLKPKAAVANAPSQKSYSPTVAASSSSSSLKRGRPSDDSERETNISKRLRMISSQVEKEDRGFGIGGRMVPLKKKLDGVGVSTAAICEISTNSSTHSKSPVSVLPPPRSRSRFLSQIDDLPPAQADRVATVTARHSSTILRANRGHDTTLVEATIERIRDAERNKAQERLVKQQRQRDREAARQATS